MDRSTENLSRWAWYSLALNVVLIALNLAVAAASGSMAVGAEAAHNVVDFLSAVGVLAAVKLAARRSRRFPFGLHKLENIASVLLGGLILLTGYEIARRALLGEHESPVAAWWMYVTLGVAVALPLVFSHFQMRAGRRANSPAIVADAREYRVHAMTTTLALVALVTRGVDLPIDRAAALLIVAAIVYTGWPLLKDGMLALLDASMTPRQIEQVREIIEQSPVVDEAPRIIGRNAGRSRFVQAVVAFRISDLSRVEQASTEIEREVRRRMPEVERLVIHPHPRRPDRLAFAVPLEADRRTVSEHLAAAPHFALLTVSIAGERLENERTVVNPRRRRQRGRGVRVAEWLIRQGADVVLLAGEPVSPGPGYVFRDGGVHVHRIDQPTLGEVRDEVVRLAVECPWRGPEAAPQPDTGDGDDET